jgi:RND family efflux transporter MFP subunit
MKKSIKILIWLLAIGGSIAIVAFTLAGNKEAANTEIQKELKPVAYNVLAAYAKEEILPNNNTFRGLVEAKSIVNIFAEADGKIISASIEKGKQITKGQTLATIDATIRSANNEINTISLTKAQQDYQIAQKNNNRYQNLIKENNASAVEVENAKQQLNAAEIQLQSIKQQIAISQKQIQQTNVIAQTSGIIIDKKAFIGDYVQPGTILGTIANLNTVLVKVFIPELSITQVALGTTVTVNIDAFPNINFNGKVVNIIPIANEAKSFPVEIEVENNKAQKLMAGMSASVSFGKKTNAKTLIIPRTAIINEGAKTFVYTIDQNKKPTKKEIVIANTIGTSVAIQSGLQVGDIIVVSGQANIEPGKILNNYSITNQ